MKFFSRRTKALTGVIVSAALVIAMLAGVPMRTEAVTSASIQEKQQQVSQTKDQIASLQSGLSDIQVIKNELERSKADLNAYIAELDAKLNDIQDKIIEYTQLIEDKEAEIEETKLELAEAERIQLEQYEAMKKRIKFMYERGDSLYLEVLFSTGSISDAISKADYIEMLSAYDRGKLDEYVATTEYVAACKEELEAEKELLDTAKAAVEEEQANVEELMGEKQRQVSSVSAEISDNQAQINEYQEDIDAANAEIAALERAIAAEIAALEAANARQYNGGVFAWPCPAYTRISDEYGARIHPITGAQQFHNGIDLAASYGSSILAAADGDVVAASYSPTMGNYIMINHGSGIYTIYMHASSLDVSKGATVSKGQVIARVGSTGRSTGNHLHFSVRQNGSYVSPWNYLG